MSDDLTRLTATDLASRILKGRVTATAAVEASLAAIARNNERLNVFITVDADGAREQAAAADEAYAKHKAVGPLHGIPIGIKDVVETRGLRTTSGSLIHSDYIPNADDLVVVRLRSAGAVIVGKTNTPEFGFGATTDNKLCGPTRNPYDENRTSGGSSGGSAVAVAAGMVPLAHGTDFGGSVRTPASFCNVVGLRPTPGRVPNVPKGLPWEALLVHGCLARTVEDVALMLSVTAGGDPRDPVSNARVPIGFKEGNESPADFRVSYSTDLGVTTVASDVAKVFENAIEAIAEISSKTEPGHPDCTGAQAAFETIRAANLFHGLRNYIDSGFDDFSETIRWNAERGRNILARDLLAAEAERGRIYARFIEHFEQFDILATVSANVSPFPNAQGNVYEVDGVRMRNIIDYLTITYVISLVGMPAISIPIGFTSNGLPVGIQLVAKPYNEARLLAYAHWLEDTLGFRHTFP